MFGEVFDTTKSFTSQFTTRNKMQAVLDFPFQDAARNFASKSMRTDQLQTFFDNDDWYTDADSNVYQLPTFLGNHDMGRIGFFVKADNEGASEDELVARDRLAHELMYFSRGNPVVYYGDEQGFTGTGGDQVARQTMFASQVPEYLDDDLLGTTNTHAQDNFVTTHPLYQKIHDLAQLASEHPALRNGAHQHRYASDTAGIYAFSRLHRGAAAGVRGGAQQQRVGEDRGDPDICRERGFRAGLRIRPADPHLQRRSAALGHRAGAVDRGLPVDETDSTIRCSTADLPRQSDDLDREPTRGCWCRPMSAVPPSMR